jgi:hypothetical protein
MNQADPNDSAAGVGFSELADSDAAGRQATIAALAQAGQGRADLVLLFSTARHDQERLLAGVRGVVGAGARIVGGGAAGVITNDHLGYEGAQVGVAVLASRRMTAQPFLAEDALHDERAAGATLGRQIALGAPPGAPLIVMYESVRDTTPEGPVLNHGTPLLAGLKDALGSFPPLVGLAFHGHPQWKPGRQYFDDRLVRQSALAVAFGGDVRVDTITFTNLRPMSTYRTVTRSEGALVLEIDGRPALDVMEELCGPRLPARDFPLHLTFGVHQGDRFATPREEDYALHLCVAVDLERRGLVVDSTMRAGMVLQLMRRDIDFADIRQRAEALVASVAGRRPFFAFYIDCAGRTGKYTGSEREEAAEVQAAIGARMPLLGMYSGGEIARVGGDVQRLTNAGVLTIFSQASAT